MEAYEKNLFYLPYIKLGHFFQRAYRISGDKKYLNLLCSFFLLIKIPEVKKQLLQLKKGQFPLEKIQGKSKKIRKQKRIDFYAKNPKARFYDAFLVSLFFLREFGFEKILAKEFAEALSYLKKEDFEKIYLNEEAIKYDSSYAFNSAIFLKHFKIVNFAPKMEKMLKDIYINKELKLKKQLPDYEFKSLIYSLTHIIISDSKFYGRYVSSHKWIVDFFENNIDLIIERVSFDILSEVALCFKLCRKEKAYEKEYKKILEFLLSAKYSDKLSDVKFLIKKEHTNSILMLLYADIDKFYSKPNMDGIIKNNFENYVKILS